MLISRPSTGTTTSSPSRRGGGCSRSSGSHPDGRLSCRLGNCPYRDSVRENRDAVCTLHRGLTRGVLDQIAPTATLARFVPHDPDVAGCEVDIVLAPRTSTAAG